MAQVLHGIATTTHAIRAEIQRSKASLRELSKKYGINPNTVLKWRRRSSVEDRKMGPKNPRSTVLSVREEALIAAFRKHTLLSLDDTAINFRRCAEEAAAVDAVAVKRPRREILTPSAARRRSSRFPLVDFLLDARRQTGGALQSLFLGDRNFRLRLLPGVLGPRLHFIFENLLRRLAHPRIIRRLAYDLPDQRSKERHLCAYLSNCT